MIHFESVTKTYPNQSRPALESVNLDVEKGELPSDEKLVGGMVRDICFRNAERYLNLAGDAAAGSISAKTASQVLDR